MTEYVPLVDYLRLGESPHLIAHECLNCRARYFNRRNACAACGKLEFADVALPTTGTVRTFTIVSFAAEGVPVPFVAAVIDCGGTRVAGNIINVPPTPEHVRVGMKVRLATVEIGADANGTVATGFAFQPAA